MRIFEGISAEGSVIGYSQGGRALLWKDDVVTWLGSQSGENGIEGVPKGISNDGSVIAGYGLRGSINEAFRWTSESLTWLGFTGEGAVQSWGMDVSADGNVLVGYNTTASGTLAFRWQDGTMVALDPIDPDKKDPVSNEPYDGSIALGISGDGSIVVGEDLTAFEGRTAVMWAAENQYAPVRLNDIVEPADRDFFNMTDVEAISADGKTIVGTGKDKGGGTAAYALLLIDDWAGYPVEPDGQSVNTGEYLGWIDIKEKPWIYIYAIDTYAYLPEEFVGPSGAWLWMLR
jgi:probable HAF family extracellular repeat protein